MCEGPSTNPWVSDNGDRLLRAKPIRPCLPCELPRNGAEIRSPHTLDTASIQFSLSYNILWRTAFDSSLSIYRIIYHIYIYKYTIIYIYIYYDSIIRLLYLYLKQLDLVPSYLVDSGLKSKRSTLHDWSCSMMPGDMGAVKHQFAVEPGGIAHDLWIKSLVPVSWTSKCLVFMDVPCWWYCFFDHFDQSSNLIVDIPVERIVNQYDI